MKFVIFAIAAAIAAFIITHIAQPVCQGGVVVETQVQCAEAGVFPAEFCARAFAKAHDIIHSGAGYSDIFECQKRVGHCIKADHMSGYVQQPKSICVAREASGAPHVEVYY